MIKIKHVINIRDKELAIPFMTYESVVRRSWQSNNDMDIHDWALLHWIYGWVMLHGPFTKYEFKAAEALHTWNPKRIRSYIERGWVVIAFRADRRNKQKNRWTMTHKGKYMIGEEYNKLMGFSLLNASLEHNPLMGEKYKRPGIDQMTQDKDFYNLADERRKKDNK